MSTGFRSMPFVKVLACSSAVLCLIAFPVGTLAWGDEGHRTVARIAANHLTPQASAAITALLSNDAFIAQCQQKHIATATLSDKLACVAVWADKVRAQRPSTAQWHFVDIPRNTDHYLPTRDCPTTPKGDCVINEIERAFADLINSHAPLTTRQEALKFIVHFVGDMHQPLHDATDTQDQEAISNGSDTDRGGNLKFVTWLGQPTNSFGNWELHAVWDSGIIETTGTNDATIANALDGRLTAAEKSFATPSIPNAAAAWRASLASLLVQWAEQSHLLAIQNAYANLGPQDQNDVAVDKGKSYHRYHLAQPYLTANLPVVEQQLQIAGLRLARVLNEAFR